MIFFTMVEENFEIWWAECLQNTLISHIFNDILHHGSRTFLNLMTWMPQNALISHIFNDKKILKFDDQNEIWFPKCYNFTHFQWYSSPWLKKILKFDDLNQPRKCFNFTHFQWYSSPWVLEATTKKGNLHPPDCLKMTFTGLDRSLLDSLLIMYIPDFYFWKIFRDKIKFSGFFRKLFQGFQG